MDDATRTRLIETLVVRARRGLSEAEDEATFWAWDAMWELVHADPEAAWLVILAVLARCDDDRMLADVAAGPLGDLICKHGPHVIDRVEREAASNPRFLRALVGVWGRNSMAADVARRLDALVRDPPPL